MRVQVLSAAVGSGKHGLQLGRNELTAPEGATTHRDRTRLEETELTTPEGVQLTGTRLRLVGRCTTPKAFFRSLVFIKLINSETSI